MAESKEFKTALNLSKRVCEFIAGEHSSVFRRIKGVSFGLSTSIITVRPFEDAPDLENVDERTHALYQDLKKGGAKELSVTLYSRGLKYFYYYNEKENKKEITQEILPEGALFRVDTGSRNSVILSDNELFRAAVGPIISPLLENSNTVDVFLNGDRFSF